MSNLFMKEKVKRNRRILIIKVVIGILLICGLLTLPSIINENWQKMQQENQNASVSGIASITSNSNVDYVIDNEKYEVDLNIIKDDNIEYTVIYGVGDERKEEKFVKFKKIVFEFIAEGENDCYIAIKKDEDILQEWNRKIYRVNSYQKQFLDELENDGTLVHYRNGTLEDFSKSYKLLKASGNKTLRVEFPLGYIYKNGEYDFSKYDEYMSTLNKDGFEIIALITAENMKNENQLIDTDQEIESFIEFANKVIEHFPYLKKFEVLNEPNQVSPVKGAYLTEESTQWYAKIIEKLTNQHKDKIFVVGGASCPKEEDTDENNITPQKFYSNIFKYNVNEYTNFFALHPYCNNQLANDYLYETMNSLEDIYNNVGGFEKISATEYGFSVFRGETNGEDILSNKLVQQSTILDKYIKGYKIQYNFWNTSSDLTKQSGNMGVITNDYKPKKSYYAMKYYHENTNGAEFIGTINLSRLVDTYIYNKDGKVKAITWVKYTRNPTELNFENLEIKDVYGNDLELNSRNNILMSDLPIYINNLSRKYFYEAISNMLIENYAKFEDKFSKQISSISGLQQKLNEMKQIAQNIGTHSEENEIDENTAIKLMEEFYDVGNILIDAYKTGNLNVNEQQLSSMLDSLNDIGDSYEDLVTITAQTRNANLQETAKTIEKANNISNLNTILNNIYPSRILSFSQDYYEKANYINGLQEENGIKTGLIVSKNLHSKLLANWATKFAENYVNKNFKIQDKYILSDEYIKNIPVATKVKDLKEQINSSFEYEIKRDNNVLEDNNTLATGDILQLKNTDKKYTIIIAGDINKDANVNITDLVKVRKSILGLTELSDLEKLAADANLDNKDISINDLVKIRKIILGI